MSTVSHSPEATSQVSDRLVQPKTRGMIAIILSALHASRLRKANRVLRHYAFLGVSEIQQNENENDRAEQDDADKIDAPIPAPK